MLRYLIFNLRIRRVEFRIAEIPILGIPIFLVTRDLESINTFSFWEGVFIFFLLFAFGDMINCLADRDLDAVYKPHLSEAVYGLGVKFVAFQIAATALTALVLAAHLSFVLARWQLFGLVAAGLTLGAAYSVKPMRLKGRGLAQLLCLWLIIFVGPILFINQLIDAVPSLQTIVLAAGYGALQMGIILVNTAEDYPEDYAAGIKTTVVALGLKRGIKLAFVLATVGGILTLSILAAILNQVSGDTWKFLVMLPAIGAFLFTANGIRKLNRSITKLTLPESISLVKNAARNVPLWLTFIAWSMLFATGAVFFLR